MCIGALLGRGITESYCIIDVFLTAIFARQIVALLHEIVFLIACVFSSKLFHLVLINWRVVFLGFHRPAS